jgi:tetratricopeptide (TPR) repeat protein
MLEKTIPTRWKIAVVGILATSVAIAVYLNLTRTANNKDRKKDSAINLEISKMTKEQMEYLKNNSSALNPEDRLKLAGEAKFEGNALYGKKNYKAAMEKYSLAIELAANAIFYSNRAACFSNLGEHAKSVEDCTFALQLNPNYLKALHRRGQSYELLFDYNSALLDYTVMCVLEEFKVEASLTVTFT